MTQQIIVDSCGWVAIIDANINFELELERMFGSFDLILLDSVDNELQNLDLDRPRRKSLLLDMLRNKSTLVSSNFSSHTDDYIFDLASKGSYSVLTIDKILKKRLYQSGISVIEVAKSNHLRLIEGL
jgi:rRNA-processing protein FCF1|tara:strand:+ start:1768 stop:2148 length:381 start_codon:yes stop_codon:yes gene_type:complete